MKKSDLKRQVTAAIQACLDKKAEELSILEMEKGSGAFTDYFPAHVEGYKQGEWILVDYVDFVVHVFSEKARKFYDLERLWKTARRLEPTELKPRRAKAAPKSQPAARRRFPARKKS